MALRNGLLLLFLPMTTGCFYHVEVQQGNLLEADRVNRLHPRMTKEQCRYLLGTALLQHPFWSDRWDYLYERRLGEVAERQRLTLFFDPTGHLIALQGDFRPRPEAIKPKPKVEAVAVPKRPHEPGLFELIEKGLRSLWPF